MIRAVVLDVDDTLCLTEAVCFDLENDVLRRMGREPMSRAVHLATWGQPLLHTMRERSPGVDLDEFAAAYQPVLLGYVRDGLLDVVTSDNLDVLTTLRAQGRGVLLLTSRTEAELAHLLAPEHVLSTHLDGAFHAGNTRYLKPDPRVFDELLSETGFPPHECVYVGDSPGDAQAANGAGLRFVASMQSGLRTRQDFHDYSVDAFARTFADLPAILDGLDSDGGQTSGEDHERDR